MFFKRRDYRMLQSPGWAFGSLGMVLFLQLLVFFLDSKTHRWFRLQGVGTLQPSEFAKPALIVFFAYFVTQKREAINTRRTIVAASLALAVLAATVGLGDLGTAIVLIVPAAVVFYVAGLERKFVVAALAVGAAVRRRIRCFQALPHGAHRRILRSRLQIDRHAWIPTARSRNTSASRSPRATPAIRCGNPKSRSAAADRSGLGLMQGKQKILYLPEAHTDFIYAVVGEELGLWGCGAILAGFLVILWRGLQLYWVANDDFGRYLALGVTSSIVIQALDQHERRARHGTDQGNSAADDQRGRQLADEHAHLSGNAAERERALRILRLDDAPWIRDGDNRDGRRRDGRACDAAARGGARIRTPTGINPSLSARATASKRSWCRRPVFRSNSSRSAD